MKSAAKHLLIASSAFIAFGTLVVSIMVYEYNGWTQKLECIEKCETLGFKHCQFRRASNTENNQCHARNNRDVIMLVLN